jgi:hypothetical protein
MDFYPQKSSLKPSSVFFYFFEIGRKFFSESITEPVIDSAGYASRLPFLLTTF